jgi:hypothetical protein
MPNPVDTFSSQIGKLETALFTDLGKIAQRLDKLSDTELITMIRELNFFQELLDRGYTDAVNGLMDAYEGQLSSIVQEASKRGIRTVKGATIQQLELLQELDTRTLLGNANAFANTLTEGLFSGIIAGESPSSIVARLAETVNLETHQLNVAVHDGFRKFDDIARHKVFEGEDIRWTYVGPIDDRTRDICMDTVSNEPDKGYTEAEVLASNTPFGDRGGFNCRHSWMVR